MAHKNPEDKRTYQKAYRAINRPWLTENSKTRSRVWYANAKIKNPKALLLRAAQSRASAAKIECTITKADFEIPLICPLLNVWLEAAANKVRPNSPSLDRIDPTKGYVPGNVWVVSYKANAMKNNASVHELVTFAHSIINLFASETSKAT